MTSDGFAINSVAPLARVDSNEILQLETSTGALWHKSSHSLMRNNEVIVSIPKQHGRISTVIFKDTFFLVVSPKQIYLYDSDTKVMAVCKPSKISEWNLVPFVIFFLKPNLKVVFFSIVTTCIIPVIIS